MSYPRVSTPKSFVRALASPPLSPQDHEKKHDIPLPMASSPIPARSTKWADGLRGISALFVLTSHLVLCFDRSLVLPGLSDGPTKLFQRPILRLISQGQAFVAIFFILLGYVNSLKVIKLSRQGKVDEALSALTISSFRRTGRLVFPAATVTIICWFATQIGVFDLARRTDAYWMSVNSTPASETWSLAFKDLFRELVGTWIWAENRYDQPQWALFHLFKGSMYVFMFLLATARVTPKARMIVSTGLWCWSWAAGDTLIGPNVFYGTFLAELTYVDTISIPLLSKLFKQTRRQSSTRRILSHSLTVLPYIILPVALTLMSYPSSYAHLAPWSNYLQDLGIYYFPAWAWNEYDEPFMVPSIDLGRAYPGLGAQILCTCVLFSAGLRRAFESKWMGWLGSVSMGIYLLHGPLMRSLLAYMVFGPKLLFDWRERQKLANIPSQQQSNLPSTPAPPSQGGQATPNNPLWVEGSMVDNPNSPPTSPAGAPSASDIQPPPPPPDLPMEPETLSLPSSFTILLAIFVFTVILLVLVQLWCQKVEPYFAKATAQSEAMCLPEKIVSNATRSERRERLGDAFDEKRKLRKGDDEEAAVGSGSENGGEEGRWRRGLPLPVTSVRC